MPCKLMVEAAVPAANMTSRVCRAESRGRLPWEEMSPNAGGSRCIPLPWWSKGFAAAEKRLEDDRSTQGNSEMLTGLVIGWNQQR